MAAYNDFFQSLKGKRNADTDEIISLTKEWRKLDAAVSFALSSDTANNRHAHANSNHIALGDSIAVQMALLINSQKRSFADYLSVVRGLNDVEGTPCHKGWPVPSICSTARQAQSLLIKAAAKR